MIDIAALKKAYTDKYGIEGCTEAELARIENMLHLKLPDDFRKISTFYSGGFLGGISHHEVSSAGNATNVVRETLRMRAAIGLDKRFIVLAEPSGSIIVLDVLDPSSVIWCDAIEADNINSLKFHSQPDAWECYAKFFSYLLEQEENQ